jgi:hypothetical protein
MGVRTSVRDAEVFLTEITHRRRQGKRMRREQLDELKTGAMNRFLAENQQIWLERALERLKELPNDAKLTREQLVDCLPLFLESLCVGLGNGAESSRRGTNAARAHGMQRHSLGMQLPQLIREYGLIGECASALCAKRRQAATLEQAVER